MKDREEKKQDKKKKKRCDRRYKKKSTFKWNVKEKNVKKFEFF